MNLAHQLQNIEASPCKSPWPGYEHFRGYGVMMLPFTSGHLLGLRVFPQNDFAPYCSVWHRPPEGKWSIYNDGPSLRTTCPRWWGPALEHTELTNIQLDWAGPSKLRVEMERPRLEWTMEMKASSLLQKINAINAALPLWTWRSRPLLRFREWMSKKLLDMGELRFSFVTPSGQPSIVMPQQIFFITSSTAILRGEDLGQPTRLPENPKIGEVPLPKDPVFMIGQAFAKIKDAGEYEESRKAMADKAGSSFQ